jgi:hypothetical protein
MRPELSPSPSEAQVGESQRPREQRTVTTLLLGRVMGGDGGDGLCRIRNLSSGGMMFEAHKRFETGERIKVELRNGTWLEGKVAWSKDGRHGVAFDQALSDEALGSLDKAVSAAKGRARAPRFDAMVATHASVEGRPVPVVLENISQSGAMLRVIDPRALGNTLILAIPQFGNRLCERRWIRGDAVGVSFAQVLSYDDFAKWLELRPTRGTPN